MQTRQPTSAYFKTIETFRSNEMRTSPIQLTEKEKRDITDILYRIQTEITDKKLRELPPTALASEKFRARRACFIIKAAAALSASNRIMDAIWSLYQYDIDVGIRSRKGGNGFTAADSANLICFVLWSCLNLRMMDPASFTFDKVQVVANQDNLYALLPMGDKYCDQATQPFSISEVKNQLLSMLRKRADTTAYGYSAELEQKVLTLNGGSGNSVDLTEYLEHVPKYALSWVVLGIMQIRMLPAFMFGRVNMSVGSPTAAFVGSEYKQNSEVMFGITSDSGFVEGKYKCIWLFNDEDLTACELMFELVDIFAPARNPLTCIPGYTTTTMITTTTTSAASLSSSSSSSVAASLPFDMPDQPPSRPQAQPTAPPSSSSASSSLFSVSQLQMPQSSSSSSSYQASPFQGSLFSSPQAAAAAAAAAPAQARYALPSQPQATYTVSSEPPYRVPGLTGTDYDAAIAAAHAKAQNSRMKINFK